ncbi:MAG: peptide-methionine (R)-S-oxide reductase MsrB [Verrucomicrobia bacterium]|nr:peptide-methionine (R)-S-oxide reductase MsrB [Verrucomicrobiota bacterium]MBS0636407.1 peptide-methionine (R)-S-oxide reductase MsrB [Verrucomicrobiota bacterium]
MITLLGISLALLLPGFVAAECQEQYRFDGKKLVLSEAEWKARLTPEEYAILREKHTECAFDNEYDTNKEPGIYFCRGCNLALFSSDSKFSSGTGWPSFFQPICPDNVSYETDTSFGIKRVEVLCSRCGGHLGHIFDDGPPPTGKRYCMNSKAMRFVPKTHQPSE